MKFTTLLFVFLLAIVFACESVKNNAQEEQLSGAMLVQTGNIVFKADSVTSYRNSYYDVISYDGKECLGLVNKNDNSLRFYNIQNKKQIKKIEFPREGPQGLTDLRAFIYRNPDSLFVFDNYGKKVLLVDFNGNLKKEYSIENEKGERLYAFARRLLSMETRPVFVKNKIYMYGFKKYNLFNPSELFEECDLEIEIDLEKETFRYIPIRYPDIYHENSYFITYSRTFDFTKNEFILSFGIDENIWTFNPEDLAKEKFSAKSQHIGKISPIDETALKSGAGSIEQYVVETPAYGLLIYDKYRDVYYRFAYHGVAFKNSDREFNTIENSSFSIVVLDKKKKKIGETYFEKEKYDFHGSFVASDGLYISTANRNNPELDEDKIAFARFTLESGEE